MIQTFEIWLKQNESLLYPDAIGLFKDSLKCFKNDIDRPSYLLAYQGMMVQIRETIKHSKMPENFPLQEWKDLLKKLKDPNDWDNANYTAVVRLKLPLILVIPDNVRKEFEHWRNLRNVCAHYKEYCFVKAHTLTLYAFIVQYLLTINVEGGMNTLLNEFEAYFDPLKTSPNEPIEPLLDKVISMVQPKEMLSFITELRKLSEKAYRFDFYVILKELFDRTEGNIKDSVIEYLQQDEKRIQGFVNEYPETIVELVPQKEAYSFAKKNLLMINNWGAVWANMLVAGMIKDKDLEELQRDLMSYMEKHDKSLYHISESQIDTLYRHGYFHMFVNEFLDSNKTQKYEVYQNINYSMSFYTSHFYNIPIDKGFVQAVIDVFSEPKYPMALGNFISDEYLKDEDIKNKFMAVLKDLGEELPKPLK